MKTIWKYALEITDVQIIEMADGAKILCCGNQYGELCLWAEVDSEAETHLRIIRVFGTGHKMPSPDSELLKYIGTVLLRGDSFVAHVYEGA